MPPPRRRWPWPPSGGLLVLWAGVDQLGPDAGVRGRLFDGAWRPAGRHSR